MREGREKGGCGGVGGLGPWEGKMGNERDGRGESNRQTRGRWEGRRGKESRGLEGGKSRRDMRMKAGRGNFILLISCLEGLIQK